MNCDDNNGQVKKVEQTFTPLPERSRQSYDHLILTHATYQNTENRACRHPKTVDGVRLVVLHQIQPQRMHCWPHWPRREPKLYRLSLLHNGPLPVSQQLLETSTVHILFEYRRGVGGDESVRHYHGGGFQCFEHGTSDQP
jgi:hypothetical protein